jgi:hypothetical protein
MPLHGTLASLFLKFPPSPYPFRLDLVTPSNPPPKEYSNSDEPEQNPKSSRIDKRGYSHEKENQDTDNYQEIVVIQGSTCRNRGRILAHILKLIVTLLP